MLKHCSAFAPILLCQHADLLLYLAPSLALAVLIAWLAARHPIFFLLTLAGTLSHELAHFVVGLLSGARPASLSVIPRRSGDSWTLGSVRLTRLRWYNAAPSALAPFLVLALPLAVGWWRTRGAWSFAPADALIALGLAPQFLSCWPSWADWKIALRSWPGLLVIVALLILFQYVKTTV